MGLVTIAAALLVGGLAWTPEQLAEIGAGRCGGKACDESLPRTYQCLDPAQIRYQKFDGGEDTPQLNLRRFLCNCVPLH